MQPLLFPQYPELTTTVLCRTLDFLNFTYQVEIQTNQILLKFTKEKSEQSIIDRNRIIRERFEILWSQLNPIGYYRFKLAEKTAHKPKDQKEFTSTIVTELNTYPLYNWESGNVTLKDSRAIILPQQLITSLVNDPSIKEQFLNNLSTFMLNSLQNQLNKFKNISELLKIINELWSNLGLGSIHNEIEQKGDEQYLIFNNNLLSGNNTIVILNPLLSDMNYSLINGEDEVKSKLSLKLVSKAKNVLIVDDEQDVIDALKREIKKIAPQTSIKTTTAPLTVKKVLEKESFVIIFIDYKMKELTGVEVLESIKDIYPNLIRILITGYGDTDIMKEAINIANVNYFINKPWKKEDILKAFNS